jgi:hypothetical protein
MTASCLAIEQKGGDRLASLPNQLLVRADLAFIDLSALRMERRNDILAGDSDCRWYLCMNFSRKQRGESNKSEQRHFWMSNHEFPFFGIWLFGEYGFWAFRLM